MRRIKDIIITKEDGTLMHLVEYACDSSEVSSLPTSGVADGSAAITTNTAEVYLFNEKTSAWVKA